MDGQCPVSYIYYMKQLRISNKETRSSLLPGSLRMMSDTGTVWLIAFSHIKKQRRHPYYPVYNHGFITRLLLAIQLGEASTFTITWVTGVVCSSSSLLPCNAALADYPLQWSHMTHAGLMLSDRKYLMKEKTTLKYNCWKLHSSSATFNYYSVFHLIWCGNS